MIDDVDFEHALAPIEAHIIKESKVAIDLVVAVLTVPAPIEFLARLHRGSKLSKNVVILPRVELGREFATKLQHFDFCARPKIDLERIEGDASRNQDGEYTARDSQDPPEPLSVQVHSPSDLLGTVAAVSASRPVYPT